MWLTSEAMDLTYTHRLRRNLSLTYYYSNGGHKMPEYTHQCNTHSVLLKCRVYILFLLPGVLLGYFSSAKAQIQVFTDESEYMTALTGLGSDLLVEDFDNSDWDFVHDATAPSVTSKEITWTGTDQVATSQGPAISGWAVYDHPGGDPDILYGASTRVLYGVGGWFKTSTPSTSIQFYLDGGLITDAHIVIGTQHSFLGVVDPDGFSGFEIRDTEGTPEDQKHWFADDFTFGVDPAPQVPSLAPTNTVILVTILIIVGILSTMLARRRAKTN
jgi:hypothetical protein